MAATAPPALAHGAICAKMSTLSQSTFACTVAAICASYNHAGLKGATDGSDRASCSCPWSHLCQDVHTVSVHVRLHGCRNLCILQPCWFEGCNRWQRPRLLLLPMEPSVPRRPHCLRRRCSCTVAAICASYNNAGLKGATDGSDRASCSCPWSHLRQNGHTVSGDVAPARLPQSVRPTTLLLQPCWFEGCNRWQRPRLLLLLMKPSPQRSPHRIRRRFSCTVATISASHNILQPC